MKIITLTLNPAFDVHCDCEDFKIYSEKKIFGIYDVDAKIIVD